jgi:hypothetical protein
MAEEFAHPSTRRAVFATTLARLVGQPHFDRLAEMPRLHRIAGRKGIKSPNPALLTVLAIDRVGPAALRVGRRSQRYGAEDATARVLRAALAETPRRRGTDRLIRIVVD